MPPGNSTSRRPLFRLDPGWLFVIAGAVLVGAMILLPAFDDLADSREQRDRARALADHAARRLASHADYLAALEKGDETLIRALAASELNLIPRSHRVLSASLEPDARPILEQLEPEFIPPQPAKRPESTLRTLATDPDRRLWVIAAGMIAILYGLLPPASRSR